MVIWRFCTNNDPTPILLPDIVNYRGDTVTVGSDGSNTRLKRRGALEFLGGVWLRDRIPILLFVATLLVMSYPLVFHLHTHIPMDNGDTHAILWQNWWLGEAVSNGWDINKTPMLFHPNGLDITIMHPRWSSLPLLLPLQFVIGDPFAHNVVAVLGLLFKAYGMYLVGLFVFERLIPAWVCGAFYSFCAPSLNYALASPNAGATDWLPWFMLAFIYSCSRILAGKRDRLTWGWMMLAGLLFDINLYLNIKIGIFAILLGGGFLVLFALAHDLWRRWLFWRGLAIFSLTAIILAAPLLGVMLGSSELGGAIDFAVESDNKGGVDLLSFVKPDQFRPFNYVQGIASLGGESVQMNVFGWGISNVGLVSFAFAIMGTVYAFRFERTAVIWVIMAAIFWLLSLGVVIHFKRKPLDFPWTLYGLFQSFPLLHIIRWPFMVHLVFLFPFAILIGYGMQFRLNSLTLDRRNTSVLVLCVFALLYGSSLFPIPLRSVERPPHVAALEELAGGAIVDVPFGRQSARYYMSLQRYHRRPIIEGFISRNPQHAYDYIKANALLNLMRGTEIPETLPLLEDWETEFKKLAADGFRYIVLHQEVLVRISHNPELPSWIWEMFSPAVPAYQDSKTRIYDITALYQPDPAIYDENEFKTVEAEALAPIQVGETLVLHAWQPVGSLEAAPCGSIGIESWWKLQQRDPTPYTVTLILANAEGNTQIAKADAVPANRFTSEWLPDRYYRDRGELQIPCDIEGGQYPVLLAMQETSSGTPMVFRYPGGETIGTLHYLTTLNIESD